MGGRGGRAAGGHQPLALGSSWECRKLQGEMDSRHWGMPLRQHSTCRGWDCWQRTGDSSFWIWGFVGLGTFAHILKEIVENKEVGGAQTWLR
jgi:hypothetical protein